MLNSINEGEFKEIHNIDKVDFYRIYCKQTKSRNILLVALLLSIVFIVGALTLNPEYSITVVICITFLEVTYCFISIKEDTTILNKLIKKGVKVEKEELDIPVDVIYAVNKIKSYKMTGFISGLSETTEFFEYQKELSDNDLLKFKERVLKIRNKKVYQKFIKFIEGYSSSDTVNITIFYLGNKNSVDIISVENEREVEI